MSAADGRGRPPLGRGLEALFGEAPAAASRPQTVAVAQLRPGAGQPRRDFDDAALDGLAASVRARGVLQPLIVRPCPGEDGRFEIVAGERRWRAAQRAGLHEVPVLVRDFDDREAREAALIENVQRQDLNPVEEAAGYARLVEEFAHTQEDLARIVGRSRSHVANTMRLLRLPEAARALLAAGALSAGHARALLAAADPAALARQVVRDGLNVRQTERLVRAAGEARPRRRAPDPESDRLAEELTRALGLKVALKARRGGGGELAIRYSTADQLDDLLRRLR